MKMTPNSVRSASIIIMGGVAARRVQLVGHGHVPLVMLGQRVES